jgi:hypothetical protein
MRDDFAVFILTNGRPDNVCTYLTLRKAGYTGKIYLIVDDLDEAKGKYREKYGKEVIVFDKKGMDKTFDIGDNFNTFRGVIYARNANFEIAKNLGIKYFMQLDDDYSSFYYRFDSDMEYSPKGIKKLDVVFSAMTKFFIDSGAYSIAMAQGGDFIGGGQSSYSKNIMLKRKLMNSFIFSTDKPIQFIGRINEDVNLYTRLASSGLLFFTLNQVSLSQKTTQKNSGGMTELYLDSGTYVKSFYSVIYHPSSVTIKMMGQSHRRLHHSVNWKNTVPLILRESLKKKEALNG